MIIRQNVNSDLLQMKKTKKNKREGLVGCSEVQF